MFTLSRSGSIWTLITCLTCGCASSAPGGARELRVSPPSSPPTTAVPQASTAAPAAGPQLPEQPELEDYLHHALARSPAVLAAFESWRAEAERGEQVATLPDPRFTYGEFLEEVQTRTGPQERRFGLSQSLPWPGELEARREAAEQGAEAGRWRLETARLEVAREVELAYHEYGFLARELQITTELLELLRGLDPVVQGRVRAGSGQADLLRLQVEMGRLEDDLATLERRRRALSARLADAAGLEGGPELLPLPTLEMPVVVEQDSRELRARLHERSPRLHELREEVGARTSAEEVAGYRRRPDLTLGLQYIQTGDAPVAGVAGSGDDPLLLSLSFSLPVWPSSYRAAEREARHRRRAATQRFEDQRSALVARVEEQAALVDDAGRRIGLYRDSLIPRAAEALQLTLADYRTGEASILDLIDAERALLEFELSRWRACREYLQGEARLKALVGGDPR